MCPATECLQHDYRAKDALADDLSSVLSNNTGNPDARDDYRVKLMCRFWNNLKENHNTDLKGADWFMPLNTNGSGIFEPHITCYQMGKDDQKPAKKKCSNPSCPKNKDPNYKTSHTRCCSKHGPKKGPPKTVSLKTEPPEKDTETVSPEPRPLAISLTNEPPVIPKKEQPKTRSPTEQKPETTTPLTQTLENMKQVAVNAKKTCVKATELINVQKQLIEQITRLEKREKQEVDLLKEADEIWKKMEAEYKQKLLESTNRQEVLAMQLKEVETSASKWKNNKTSLEEQRRNAHKLIIEIRDKHRRKTNELRDIEMETTKLENNIERNTKEISLMPAVLQAKKKTFDNHMKTLSEEYKKLHTVKKDEENLKKEKIAQGDQCAKVVSEELAKLCKALLKKKLENENLRAEARALAEEISLLTITCDTCCEKSKIKEQTLKSEIEKCDSEIERLKLKCTKCHASCDTQLLRKYCTDCPRCQEEIVSCTISGNICNEVIIKECVCVRIKFKFMNNVFENMQTLLERQINTASGKAVADQVLECLKRSSNGKLDLETRNKLQDFILSSVKRNLNLTIIGGAVKTRCEMDPDTYKEMTKCLKQIKTKKPEKIDMGTDSRKSPCAHWADTNECNCPNGPTNCICKSNVLKSALSPRPCGQRDKEKKDENQQGDLSICPRKKNATCGPLCSNIPNPDIARNVTKVRKLIPCSGEYCKFNKNTRAAQCDSAQDCSFKNVLGIKKQCDCGSGECDCCESLHL